MVKKIILISTFLVLLSSFIFLTLSDQGKFDTVVEFIPENHLSVDNLSMIRLLGNDGGYVKINAEEAYFDKNINKISLKYSTTIIIDGTNTFSSISDDGEYVIGDTLKMEQNLHGRWNSLDYRVSPNGAFTYDFKKAHGIFAEDVVFIDDNGSIIKSKQVDYNANDKTILFSGGVEMFFPGSLND